MRSILIVGSGGREHVLVWRLAQDAAPYNLHAAPGNPGIARLASSHSVGASEISALADLAAGLEVDLTVVGPEAPLAAGVVDAFRARRLRIFGPTQSAAHLESSKVFAKTLMGRHGIPTASFAVFDRVGDAIAYVRRAGRPLVIKADGLAGGKGVTVAVDGVEAEAATVDLMVRRVQGDAGHRVVIEERLDGREVSVLAFVNGTRVFPLVPAVDFKRARDGDAGPNTGGMGAVAPAALPPAVIGEIVHDVLEPVAAAMAGEGHPYTGVLYAGMMLTADGPKVLEFNCRFGDPEAQVILPLLRSDLGAAMIETLEGGRPDLQWRDGAAVCVVLASGGYPGRIEVGAPITGLDDVPSDILVFHAGTALHDGRLITSGGRVLNVVAPGATIAEARDRAYAGVARIHFDGMHFRRDIAAPFPVAEEVRV